MSIQCILFFLIIYLFPQNQILRDHTFEYFNPLHLINKNYVKSIYMKFKKAQKSKKNTAEEKPR